MTQADTPTTTQTTKYKLENRRYIGCKAKLIDWIFQLIDEYTYNVHTFCDIFAGTGVVANKAISLYNNVIINDFLPSNNIIYKAFFADIDWDYNKVDSTISYFNSISPQTLKENYFSINYGGKYFENNLAKLVGFIREFLQNNKNEFNEKEYAILLSSLIYSIDRKANTLGHFDAYIKKDIKQEDFVLRMIDAFRFPQVEIYQEDSNSLARNIHVDVLYMDPPYNSRQYSRFYHVYDNLVQWKKPELFGTGLKPKAENMSDYCKSSALRAFTDLVAHADTRYFVVSYNNTYHSKSKSSENKIKLEEIEDVLNKCGDTLVFTHQYNPFNSGKTEFDDHKEYLFITEVNNEKRNCSFSSFLRG